MSQETVTTQWFRDLELAPLIIYSDESVTSRLKIDGTFLDTRSELTWFQSRRVFDDYSLLPFPRSLTEAPFTLLALFHEMSHVYTCSCYIINYGSFFRLKIVSNILFDC